jgi:hypothetical protein
MSALRIDCRQCGKALVVGDELAGARKVRCPDCKAIIALPDEHIPAPAAKPELRPSRPRRSSRSGIPLVWIAVGSAILLILAVSVVVVVVVMRGMNGAGPLVAGNPFSPSALGINPLATKANFVKLDEAMTLDEVQAILGPGASAGESEMEAAFGEGADPTGHNGTPGRQWMFNGRSAGVTSWYQWRAGNFSIFVGFARGSRTGKEKALLSFWVDRFGTGAGGLGMHGFNSEVGFLATGDPDKITDAHEAQNRLLNDPKWKKGNPRQLLIGRWQDAVNFGYEFTANGAVKSFGLEEYASTYRFIDDSHIEINVPAAPLVPAHVAKYRVLVNETEMILGREQGHRLILTEHKRVR